MFLKMSKPSAVTVLSVLVEKMCWEVNRLGSIKTFDESTGPVLANLLSTPVVCDLISAVREYPLRAFLGRSSRVVSEDRWEDQVFSQGPSDLVDNTK